jgi:hypothetical protein
LRKVLIISYHFPPIGASQRVLKFVKYLPQFGWYPIVLAPARSDYPKVDSTLLAEIPKKSKIARLPGCASFPGNPYITIPDLMSGWFPQTVTEGLRLIEEYNIDAIYSVSAPYVSLLAGLALKKLTGKPLVIDLRDEWTTNPFVQDTKYTDDIRFNQTFERLVLRQADSVISVTGQITKSLYRLSGKPSIDSFYTIENGFDPADFTKIQKKTKGNRFVICYMGSIYGLRKGIFNRFFEQLNSAVSRGKIPLEEIEIRLVGYLNHLVFPEKWMINQVVNKTGYLNHRSALQMAASSNLLLLLIDPRETTTITSKIYELLYLNKPILAVVPPKGPAGALMRETNAGVVIDSKNPGAAIPVIRKFMAAWRLGRMGISPKREVIQNYSRIAQTKKLAAILKKTVVQQQK